MVGLAAFPLFYMLRYTERFPDRYDDFQLRAIAVLLCLPLALRRWWPARARPLYLGYSYGVIFYCFSFMFSFTALKNQGETFSVVNLVLGAFLTILLVDWRNALLMQFLGYGLSATAFNVLHPNSPIPGSLLLWMPACLLVVGIGALAYYAQKQAELQRMRKVYEGIAGSIAHELRAPMQKIQDVFDSLERDFIAGRPPSGGSLSVQWAIAMAGVVQDGRNAVKLGLQSIEVTLQQLNTRAHDTSRFTSLSAAVCVERALHEYAYDNALQRDRVRFEEVADFSFNGNETILTLILFNLLKNALHYLPAYPSSVVTVTVDTRCITVRDTGPGIDPERIPRLFEDFHTFGKPDGTGLGLSFCQRAMRSLGGEITCVSEPGTFTAFTLSFPEVPQAQAAAQDEAVVRCAGELLRGCRVLVVDDDTQQRRDTVARFQALGGTSSIDEVKNGVQAVEMLTWASLVPYDLVVTNLELPMLDGQALVQQMRLGGVPRHERVPVLGHSGEPVAQARAKARKAGMNGFLRKPCELPDLARAVVALLKDQPVRGSPIDLAPFAGQTALLAEDNDVNRGIVKGYLEELGISVMEARHGFDVLQCVKVGARPAVIVMDLEMPGLGGIETTRQLREMGDMTRGIPVLALTGKSSKEVEQAARDAGMEGFLTKPVNVLVLRQELGRMLKPHPVASGGSSQASAVDESLLDLRRIQHMRQMDIMASLLPEGLTKARRLVEALEHAFVHDDLRAGRRALTALMGLSGEMGGQAVYEATRRHSLAVEDGIWPPESGWLERLKALMVQSERALLVSYGLGSVQL